ncbi:SMI1/KNR4 family protein [Hymenobacter terrenus]|uniref:SMI1/KNR4 family protein n=1 Tax=Hymenobacter terrenus TaxID=1629124 RepID=UPI0009E548A0|nr:SMI1/KNR4 family protein [Hymenobacter terrenus]
MNCMPFSAVTEQDIVTLEQQLGARLPDDYRQFLLQTNGVDILDQTFFVKDLDQEVMLHVLFGLTNPTSRGLTMAYWLKEYGDEIDPYTLIIGKDAGGRFLLYTVAGEDTAGIYYWDHNDSFPQSKDGEGNTYFVADTFTEFCDSLRDYTPVRWSS